MVVLAYQSSQRVPGTIDGYIQFIGQVELPFTDNAEIDIGLQVYNELLTLPPATPDAWGYVYSWKAAIFQDESNSDLVTSFASIPPRYKFGHITAASNAGIVWNDVLTFEDQITPPFRANFYTDNPNPGDGFPFGTTPLGDSVVTTWRAYSNFPAFLGCTYARASYLNIFQFQPAPYIVRISYTGALSFNGLDILAAAPLPFVVSYP